MSGKGSGRRPGEIPDGAWELIFGKLKAAGQCPVCHEIECVCCPTDDGPGQDDCQCSTCLDARGETVEFLGMQVPTSGMRMVLCTKCGNKRCPHARDHRNACTSSNEPGQPGSNYADQVTGQDNEQDATKRP